MQSPRFAAVEALSKVMHVPEVEVADLRTFNAHNTEKASDRHLRCLGVTRRHRELGNFGQLGARSFVKRGIERWQLLDRIRQPRRCPAPCRRVRGWRRMWGLRHAFSTSEGR